jgi:hypothetical protein
MKTFDGNTSPRAERWVRAAVAAGYRRRMSPRRHIVAASGATGLDSLRDLVAATIADWPHGSPLARVLVGRDDASSIANAMVSWCRAETGRSIVVAHRFEASVGLVADVDLDDGSRAVIKAVLPGEPAERLAASVRVRAALGPDYPCPVPIAGPAPFGPGAATIDSWLEPGATADPRALAVGLADLVARAAGFDRAGLPRLLAARPGSVWPEPHDLRFDFDRSADGAGWIDDAARRARRAMRASADAPPVVAHVDWRAEHVHVDDAAAIVATYDWDSVAAGPEAWFVGHTAAIHPCDWSTEPAAPLPAPAEVEAFIAAYEEAARRSVDRQAARAAALLAFAYGARCVHSDRVLLGWPDRAGFVDALRAWARHCGS